jgi:hypothetical protein
MFWHYCYDCGAWAYCLFEEHYLCRSCNSNRLRRLAEEQEKAIVEKVS